MSTETYLCVEPGSVIYHELVEERELGPELNVYRKWLVEVRLLQAKPPVVKVRIDFGLWKDANVPPTWEPSQFACGELALNAIRELKEKERR